MKCLWISILVFTSLVICASASDDGAGQSTSQLHVFVEPTNGYKPVLDALNLAHSSILVEMYLLTNTNIIEALKNASSRGVKVRVILEPWAYDNSGNLNATLNSLESSGISVEAGSPAFRLTHEKAIVIDDGIAIIMTLNQDYFAYTENREFGVLDYNSTDVGEIASVFEADWNRTSPELSDPNLVWSPVNPRDRIINLMDSANKSIEIEAEEMQDQEIEDHLVSAAKRGVDVEVVMSPSNSNKDPNTAGRTFIAKGGVKVRLLTNPYIHAKIIIADGIKAFIGSENFSPTSLNSNRELGILVDDPGILRVLSSTFDMDWNAGIKITKRAPHHKPPKRPTRPNRQSGLPSSASWSRIIIPSIHIAATCDLT
jgi:cardiolipin synthase